MNIALMTPEQRREMSRKGHAARKSYGKLTPAAVRFVRQLHAERERTGRRIRPLHKELCARWGVSSTTLSDITRGRTYRWVK